MATTQTKYPPITDEARVIFWSLGDANKDGVIDNADLALVKQYYDTDNGDCDFNGDGKVSLADLSILARNFGLNINTWWQNICDKEAQEQKLSVQTGVPNLPWYVDWILPLLQAQKQNTEAYAYWQQPAMAALVQASKALANLASDTAIAHLEGEQNINDWYNASFAEKMGAWLNGDGSKMPKPVVDVHSQLYTDYQKRIHGLMDATDPTKYMAGNGDDAQVFLMSVEMFNNINNYLSKAQHDAGIANAITLGLFDTAQQWINFTDKMLGASGISAYINAMAAKKVYDGGLDRYYNTIWTPYIPSEREWIQLYTRGEIDVNSFYREMQRLGFAGTYAMFKYKAQLTMPSVTDILTAWRRGKIYDGDVDSLFTFSGLDPKWKPVFDTRKFTDISIGTAHGLYDVGLIDESKLLDTAHRSGFDIIDAALVVDSVKQFPIRRLKARHIFNLVTAYAYSVVDSATVTNEVTGMGFSAAVGDWVVKVGELRKLILNRAKTTKAKPKLLSLGDLKAAYLRGLLTEDQFRTELLTRGYNLDDVTILIEVMTERRTVEQAGGKMYALSVVELLNAWRYGAISEDVLRNKLLARGLPLDELDALIATKKVQWQITPSAAG